MNLNTAVLLYSVVVRFCVPDEFCEEYPHNLIPTPGYWIECSRQKITTDTIWDESESEHDSAPDRDTDVGRRSKYELRITSMVKTEPGISLSKAHAVDYVVTVAQAV
ncbi:hypothetical protein EVAR_51257_1 [Eumeta japonica]|uniref:Uncharacterized protein n=1 Tax=Eumeta variegata TaxID=151549 RepID=A0A4C1X0X9_EUMVA|nr:hypothetical protein EVAR_51257_1 [Eumeta japonica]